MQTEGVGMMVAKVESSQPLVISGCGLAMMAALVLGVGVPGHMVVRHIVQTLPLWPAVILGLQRSRAAGWAGFPLFAFWAVLMTLIWVHLLGVWNLISGHFSVLEIAMTIVVGIACGIGMVAFMALRSALPPLRAALIFCGLGVLQIVCMRISFLPEIAHR